MYSLMVLITHKGQLGNDVIAPSTASFTKISALKDIKSIAAGDSHNIAVDTNGRSMDMGCELA